jgi:hypothetical protein
LTFATLGDGRLVGVARCLRLHCIGVRVRESLFGRRLVGGILFRRTQHHRRTIATGVVRTRAIGSMTSDQQNQQQHVSTHPSTRCKRRA